MRALCVRHGILFVADEATTGFGRAGEWLAVDRWAVGPDLITFAKGVNSGYVLLGGVIVSDCIAATFEARPFPGGLTYSGYPRWGVLYDPCVRGGALYADGTCGGAGPGERGIFLSGAREDGTDEPTGDGIGTVIVASAQLVVPPAAASDADVVCVYRHWRDRRGQSPVGEGVLELRLSGDWDLAPRLSCVAADPWCQYGAPLAPTQVSRFRTTGEGRRVAAKYRLRQGVAMWRHAALAGPLAATRGRVRQQGRGQAVRMLGTSLEVDIGSQR